MADEENPWKPYDITDATIDQEIEKHKLFVVDCWAEWCAPCRTVSKYHEMLSKEYKGEVTFAKLDMEKNKATSKKYGIITVPTLLLFYEGKFEDIVLGAMNTDYIKSIIEGMVKRAGAKVP
jgi:thioredoxin 1